MSQISRVFVLDSLQTGVTTGLNIIFKEWEVKFSLDICFVTLALFFVFCPAIMSDSHYLSPRQNVASLAHHRRPLGELTGNSFCIPKDES